MADGVIVRVAPEYYVTLVAEREPELPFAALGGVLVILGLFGLVVWPPRENWVSISRLPDGSQCRFFASAGDAETQWFTRAHIWLTEANHE